MFCDDAVIQINRRYQAIALIEGFERNGGISPIIPRVIALMVMM